MTSPAFERVEGRPRLIPCLVAYMDVLGITAAYRSHPDETAEVLDAALGVARDYLNTQDSHGRGFVGTATHDTMTLGLPLDDRADRLIADFAVQAVQLTQASLASFDLTPIAGLFTRGSLAAGLHFVDERFVGGPALAEAVAAEKNAPWRNRPVVRVLESAVHLLPEPAQPMGPIAWTAEGPFVNYLGGYAITPGTPASHLLASDSDLRRGLRLHHARVAQGLATPALADDVRCKLEWLAGYHNAFCAAVDLTDFMVAGIAMDPGVSFTPDL